MQHKLSFYALTDSGECLDFERYEEDGVLSFRLSHTRFSNAKEITVTSDAFAAQAGDKGYYLLPGNRTIAASMLTFFSVREDCEWESKDSSLTLLAVGKADGVYAVIPERYYTFQYIASCRGGVYRTAIKVDFENQPTVDDLILRVLILPSDADYNDVARAVREYRLGRGEIQPLREKCAAREELDYARKYPLIRIRMGWKPAPPTVLHQTLENEPPMHVACTFARVRELADELKRQGLRGATFSLVGWNVRGHDGRWPQVFPVEEALGGEAELKKTIEHVQSLGYRITCHTNLLDHYEIADCYDTACLSRRRNGEYYHSGDWSGGRGLRACPTHQLIQSEEQLSSVAALGFRGLHYIDVMSIISPDACFHPDHPCSTRQGIAHMCSIMRRSTELLGGFSSEGCMDFALGELDYSLYNSFREFPVVQQTPAVDEWIPLWELIYHGVTLYNPNSTTVNCAVKTAKERTTFHLLGGVPTFYYYSKFRTGAANWMGETDLTCDDDKTLCQSVASIVALQKEYEVYSDRQLIYLKSYRHLANGLYEVLYEDGSGVAANYTDAPLVYNGKTVLANSYLFFDAKSC